MTRTRDALVDTDVLAERLVGGLTHARNARCTRKADSLTHKMHSWKRTPLANTEALVETDSLQLTDALVDADSLATYRCARGSGLR